MVALASNLPALTYKKPNSLDKLITWVHPIFDYWVNSATRSVLQLSKNEKSHSL